MSHDAAAGESEFTLTPARLVPALGALTAIGHATAPRSRD